MMINKLIKVSLVSVSFAFLLSGCAKKEDTVKENDMKDNVTVEASETTQANQSRPLSEISKETVLEKQDCEDKFKNKDGICEVPNPEYPKELIEEKYEKKDEDKD